MIGWLVKAKIEWSDQRIRSNLTGKAYKSQNP